MSEIEIGSEWKDKDSSGLVEITEVLDGHVRYTWEGERCGWDIASFLQHFEEYTPVSKKLEPKTDMVNHPPHYKDASGIECCQVTDFMMFNAASCFKYLYRCGNKWDDIEDLKKAVWYAKRAYLTGNNKQPNSLQWDQDIRAIASYRKHGIRKAMTAIRTYSWLAVAAFIESEIARLESEQ